MIETLGRFLDPLIVRPSATTATWTPNGNHRLQAMRRLGAKAVVALLDPGTGRRLSDPGAQHREGAQPAREVAGDDPHGSRARRGSRAQPEEAFAFQFEQPSFLTLGAALRVTPTPERRRLPVGAAPDRRIPRQAVVESGHRARAAAPRLVLAIDDRVTAIVDKLKARGLTSPYLRPFVVARINPIRFSKATSFDFDDVMQKMTTAAGKVQYRFRVKPEEVTRASGPPVDEE